MSHLETSLFKKNIKLKIFFHLNETCINRFRYWSEFQIESGNRHGHTYIEIIISY